MPLINSVSDRNNRNLPSKNLIESNILRSYLLKIISKREREREKEEMDVLPIYKKKRIITKFGTERERLGKIGEVWKIFDRNGERYGFNGGVSPSLGPTLVSINGGLIGDVG